MIFYAIKANIIFIPQSCINVRNSEIEATALRIQLTFVYLALNLIHQEKSFKTLLLKISEKFFKCIVFVKHFKNLTKPSLSKTFIIVPKTFKWA